MQSYSVFTYGTLEIPEVMAAVTGKDFESIDALASGFQRFLLRGRIYPGMIEVPNGRASGRLYFGVGHQELALLDQFEDDIYVRKVIAVTTGDGGEFQTFAYIIESANRDALTETPWNREDFVAKHLPGYLSACRRFHLSAKQAISHPSHINN